MRRQLSSHFQYQYGGKVLLLWGFMAVVSHYVLGNISGLQQLDAAVTIQHNSCAKSAKLSIKYSRETKTEDDEQISETDDPDAEQVHQVCHTSSSSCM